MKLLFLVVCLFSGLRLEAKTVLVIHGRNTDPTFEARQREALDSAGADALLVTGTGSLTTWSFVKLNPDTLRKPTSEKALKTIADEWRMTPAAVLQKLDAAR